ncbi:nuclease-related domain-containing DEAD/DEAH box helicase [Aliiglaciecola litoralis]|uniref:ATP-binding domain-containing protein n=1 Tax=Aliiglaciecola litoralis TaxID=582857 RepID=A0ABN1LIC6_9ALTE
MRIIPQNYSENTPPGEKDVFNLFSQSNSNWVVFHSIDIAPFTGQQYRIRRREIDFIAIIPEVGILCIEVKSHNYISFDGGGWRPDSIKSSPFSQSSGASAAFFKALMNYWPEAKKIPVVSCCIFPNAIFELTPNIQVNNCELMDSRAFRSLKHADEFTHQLKAMAIQSISNASNISTMSKPLNGKEISKIVKLCQPFSTVKQTPREEIEFRDSKNESLLIEQQRVVFQLFKLNSKVLVNGGAGTGKTLISIMVAEELSRRNLKVGVFCFNKLVGDWLKMRLDNHKNFVVGSINSALISHCKISLPKIPDQTFWLNVPLKIASYFQNQPSEKFDVLIVDEAQDILGNDNWLNCLEHSVEGGLKGGKYLFLGDFENQLLFNKLNLQINLELLEIEYSLTKWLLSENCRNYEEVGENAIRLAGMEESPYSNYLKKHKPSISLYEIKTFAEPIEQIDEINLIVKGFLNEGYMPSEITLMSFKPLKQSTIKVGDRLGSIGVRRNAIGSEDLVLESIYTYKGMENKIIIYFDVEVSNTEICRDLMYTGITRATEAVRLFVNERSKQILVNWLMS